MVNFDKLQHLETILAELQQMDYPVHSRIHPLKSFPSCYVKRDDELGFGISGSKMRKFRSLIPYLKLNSYCEVVVIGGAYSNNVLGIIQLLIENGLKFKLFLRGDPIQKPIGNALWIKMFAERSSIKWISRKEWPDVENIARKYAQNEIDSDKKIYILPEGAFVPEALPGSVTLSLDIVRNEQQSGNTFNHIFVDSGTGLMAIGLILGHAWMEVSSLIHVLLLADEGIVFRKKLDEMHQKFEHLLNKQFDFHENFIIHTPKTGASFGSVTKQTLTTIKQIAMVEGFLTDPIYSAKLFCESKRLITQNAYEGSILIVHSGGGLSLSGFQDKLNAD